MRGAPRGELEASSLDAQVCVYASGRGVACAHGCFKEHLNVSLRSDPIAHLTDLHDVLAEQVNTLGIARRPESAAVNLVLAPELYSVSLVDRPDVEDEDLNEAVRWIIQDQVDYPMENATLDVFDLPRSASRERPMVFVVSVKTDLLRTLVSEVNATGLKVASIDASELSLRNLAWQCFPQADQNIAVLRLTSNSGVVNISRADELYLARRVSGVPEQFSESTWEDYRERMVLQVQRSIDYYESAMNQPHCNMLLVACTHDWSAQVTEYLTEMLPIPVRSVSEVLAHEMDLTLYNPDAQIVDWENISTEQGNALAAGLPAIGGVLRKRIAKAMAEAA